MTSSSDTQDSLLIRLRDSRDRDSWDLFVDLYQPLIYRIARSRGLQDADAQDLTQKVLISVTRAIPKWKRNDPKAKFRHWLRRVANNAVLNELTRGPKDKARGGSSAMNRMATQPQQDDSVKQIDREIETEYQRQLYRQAAVQVRSRADETTWLAFSMTMIDGMSISEAAKELDRSEGTVYAARSRIVRRLRDSIHKLEAE